MVTIEFVQKGKKYKKGFYDLPKAVRFIYGIKRKGAFVLGYTADDYEEVEYLMSRGC